jgi:hypothetical protein
MANHHELVELECWSMIALTSRRRHMECNSCLRFLAS